MNQFGFPKYGKSQHYGKVGESFFETFVHKDLRWIYRSTHQESDFGIDGYIDIVINGNVTGQTIGVQIKCGDSYFNKKSKGGIRYVGSNKHLNYYINNPFPIILIVLNSECTDGKWIEFDLNYTSPTRSGWWIEIPKKNILSKLVKSKWELIAGPVSENSEKILSTWKTNEAIDKSDFGIYIVHKDDILAYDFSGLKDVIDRLSRNKASLLRHRGTLEILISGYDEDPRGIYEIPEVRKWYSESLKAGIPWFYFLGKKYSNGMGLTVLFLSCCDIEVNSEKSENTYCKISDIQQVQYFLNINFHNLNLFTEEKEISEEVNAEMSKIATSLLMKNFWSG